MAEAGRPGRANVLAAQARTVVAEILDMLRPGVAMPADMGQRIQHLRGVLPVLRILIREDGAAAAGRREDPGGRREDDGRVAAGAEAPATVPNSEGSNVKNVPDAGDPGPIRRTPGVRATAARVAPRAPASPGSPGVRAGAAPTAPGDPEEDRKAGRVACGRCQGTGRTGPVQRGVSPFCDCPKGEQARLTFARGREVEERAAADQAARQAEGKADRAAGGPAGPESWQVIAGRIGARAREGPTS